MVEMWHLQLLETSRGFFDVSGAEVLFEQKNDFLDEILDGPVTAAHSPHVVQANQAVFHREKSVRLAESSLGLACLNVTLITAILKNQVSYLGSFQATFQ